MMALSSRPKAAAEVAEQIMQSAKLMTPAVDWDAAEVDPTFVEVQLGTRSQFKQREERYEIRVPLRGDAAFFSLSTSKGAQVGDLPLSTRGDLRLSYQRPSLSAEEAHSLYSTDRKKLEEFLKSLRLDCDGWKIQKTSRLKQIINDLREQDDDATQKRKRSAFRELSSKKSLHGSAPPIANARFDASCV
jgi:hypothetical protein